MPTPKKQPLDELDILQGRIRMDSLHRYLVYKPDEEKWVPYAGTTSVMGDVLAKPALVQWAAGQEREHDIRVAYTLPKVEGETPEAYAKRFGQAAGKAGAFRKTSEAAANRGTIVHALIEAYLRKQLNLSYEVPEEVGEIEREMFRQWLKWEKSVELVPLRMENRICDDDLQYAGTFDLLAKLHGELYLLDVKTGKPLREGNAPYTEWSLQSGAYRNCLYKLGFPAMKAGIMLVPRDGGEVKLHRLEDDHTTAFDAFQHLLAVRRWMNIRESFLPPPE
jgi:hypothetical protein